MKKIPAKFILISFLVIASLLFIRLASAEQSYYPYPVVFVHGINSSDRMWINTRDNLRQYFRTSQGMGEYKYPDQTSEKNYFIGCDYEILNNGHIPSIAIILSSKIDEALSYYPPPPEVPENERKVIIVCHSMGGLVTRSLLTQIPDYKDKIYRVVFIDTPHLGSPYASVLWLLNEINAGNGQMNPPPKEFLYHSFGAFSSFPFNNTESVEYGIVSYKILNTRANIFWLLKLIGLFGGPKPDGAAVRDLRTPAYTSYNATYSGLLSGLTVTESKSYSSTDTFLGQANLDVPSDSKVITGKNTAGWETAEWGINKLLNFSSPFTFSDLAGEPQTIGNAVVNGDGVVTMSSQKAVTGKADYQVNGFHVGVADNAINETLQAIDDPPTIEDATLIRVPGNCAIRIKVKEYLLADIEISKLTVNDVPVNPSEFYDSVTDTYKPYVKYGKAFLEERNGLMPGEFEVELPFYDLFGPGVKMRKIYVELKNPAQKKASCAVYLMYDNCDVYRHEWSSAGPFTFSFLELRDRAYAEFLAKAPVSGGGFPFIKVGEMSSLAAVSGPYYNKDRGLYYTFSVSMERVYKQWVNFKLDIADKQIESAKFKGSINFSYQCSNNKQERKDFNILTYRDLSGSWPPPITLVDNHAKELLFSQNTAIYENKKSFKFEREIQPKDINPNADNVWEFTTDIPEYNFIYPTPDYPDFVFIDQQAIISEPILFIKFK